MHYHPFGRTGLSVSAISLGGAGIGQQFGPVTVAEAADCVHSAIDAGVNLIDTSAYYGLGKSEEILGQVLRGGWREKVHLCTKAGRLDRDQFDFTPAGMRTCFEGSLKRLQTDHVEILLAHDIEFATDFDRVFDETADVLHQLKAEGKCRFIGMSCLPLGLLQQAIERCSLDVVISYCHYNLQDTTLVSSLLPVADARGTGVINASPLAMGLLTQAGPPAWHPAPEPIQAACRAAAELCQARGADLATLGMQFCFAERRIPTTLTGTAKADEFAANLKAMTTPPDPELLAAVQAVLAPVADQTWPSGNWVLNQV